MMFFAVAISFLTGFILGVRVSKSKPKELAPNNAEELVIRDQELIDGLSFHGPHPDAWDEDLEDAQGVIRSYTGKKFRVQTVGSSGVRLQVVYLSQMKDLGEKTFTGNTMYFLRWRDFFKYFPQYEKEVRLAVAKSQKPDSTASVEEQLAWQELLSALEEGMPTVQKDTKTVESVQSSS